MSSIVIRTENISKQYRLGSVGTGSLIHDINRVFYRFRGKEDPYLQIGETNDRSKKGSSKYVWALKDINFEVNQGEVLGIIGRNGAGKSTLLKILSRTTTPTTGSIKIKGRVASLLEVGTGFHPELSGRENIFLNGAILGMTKHEIIKKFDEIVDFAGVERYIDTPVKRYSSGMYVRLAFGVAAHLEPEILVVDEVLAVGDAEFQKKALGKMKDVSSKDGRTVLFVSHNMTAINSLCQKGLLLSNGLILESGPINNVLDTYYNSFRAMRSVEYIGEGPIRKAYIKTSNSGVFSSDELKIVLYFFTEIPIQNIVLGIVIRDHQDTAIVGVNNKHYYSEKLNNTPLSEGEITITIPSISLMPGDYKIDLFLGDSTTDIDIAENALHFTIQETNVNPTSIRLDYRLNKIFLNKIKWDLSTDLLEK